MSSDSSITSGGASAGESAPLVSLAEALAATSITPTAVASFPKLMKDLPPNEWRDGFMKLPRHLKEMIIILT